MPLYSPLLCSGLRFDAVIAGAVYLPHFAARLLDNLHAAVFPDRQYGANALIFPADRIGVIVTDKRLELTQYQLVASNRAVEREGPRAAWNVHRDAALFSTHPVPT